MFSSTLPLLTLSHSLALSHLISIKFLPPCYLVRQYLTNFWFGVFNQPRLFASLPVRPIRKLVSASSPPPFFSLYFVVCMSACSMCVYVCVCVRASACVRVCALVGVRERGAPRPTYSWPCTCTSVQSMSRRRSLCVSNQVCAVPDILIY